MYLLLFIILLGQEALHCIHTRLAFAILQAMGLCVKESYSWWTCLGLEDGTTVDRFILILLLWLLLVINVPMFDGEYFYEWSNQWFWWGKRFDKFFCLWVTKACINNNKAACTCYCFQHSVHVVHLYLDDVFLFHLVNCFTWSSCLSRQTGAWYWRLWKRTLE